MFEALILMQNYIKSLIKLIMQRCPSGLRCSPGKAVCKKLHQEFESLSLRQIKRKTNGRKLQIYEI